MERPPSNLNMKSMYSEREKFRTYVEKSGVMSALTDVLVRLYEEPNRPSDALTYIKDTLGSVSVDIPRLELLEAQVTEHQSVIDTQKAALKSKDEEIETKDKEIALLKERLAKLEVKEEPSKEMSQEGSKNS
ncbi:hypothetical protein SK128_021137 [Halocaridina rubra]|uniref:c-Myc-binding protein n=1 Tax=Halocaridina rubra TaxID=373956 RepID=A0AAN8XFC4_HALRR